MDQTIDQDYEAILNHWLQELQQCHEQAYNLAVVRSSVEGRVAMLQELIARRDAAAAPEHSDEPEVMPNGVVPLRNGRDYTPIHEI